MRLVFAWMLLLLAGRPAWADTPLDAKALDKQLAETLREVHNRGATLFNQGDVNGCLRTFEGALEVAKGALKYRPDELKYIEDGLKEAASLPGDNPRAHKLRETIDETRRRLLGEPEKIPVHPRAVKLDASKEAPAKIETPKGVPEKKKTEAPKDAPEKRKEPKSGVDSLLNASAKDTAPAPESPAFDPRKCLTGTLLWQGRPLEGVHILFVQRDAERLRIFEATTGREGKYHVEGIERSKYTTLLNPAPSASPFVLPERYRTTTDSPLIYFISGPGDTLDFLLK